MKWREHPEGTGLDCYKKEQLYFRDRLVWVWVQRTAGSGTFSLPSCGRETPETAYSWESISEDSTLEPPQYVTPVRAHSVFFCLPPPPAGTSLDCRPLTPPYPRLAPQVPRSEASTFSASHHVAYFEASAKLRLNVDEAFEQLVRAVR